MNKKFLYVLISFIIVITIVSSSYNYNSLVKREIDNFYVQEKEELEPINKVSVSFQIVDEGYDIYMPNGSGYRYGPSIIYYDDNTVDAYFASPGNYSEWDWITYRHYDGENWSNEEVVLTPTKNSLDHYSVCDPGVIYFNGYYYLGYTSTTNAAEGGIENSIFVARSENPNGPFEKWNGNGWGGDPKPIIYYEGEEGYWGIGEVSFVIVDDKLYCYYTSISEDGSNERLAIADTSENWPNTLVDQGYVMRKINYQDSSDVIYVDECNLFVALSIENRFQAHSGIAVYQSKDGINFEKVDSVNEGVNKYAHNMGISKKPSGHISIDDNLLVGYAYGFTDYKNSWGRWATKFQKIQAVLKSK